MKPISFYLWKKGARTMTFRHLKIFLTVCETMNMTKAAGELHISQPSITQAIHELEDHYGILLFKRTGRKILLTPAGRHLENLPAKSFPCSSRQNQACMPCKSKCLYGSAPASPLATYSSSTSCSTHASSGPIWKSSPLSIIPKNSSRCSSMTKSTSPSSKAALPRPSSRQNPS